jgi:tetratricopeptide (TPR) repeat protein
MLIEAFDGNALGLAQGANYCLTTGITPEQYVERLRRDPVQMLDKGRAAGHPQTIAAAISVGLTEAYENPAALALASALSWLAPDPVPEWIFGKPPVLVEPAAQDDTNRAQETQEAARDIAVLVDLFVLDTAVASLARHGLVSRGPGGLRMHHIVQDVTQALTDESAWHAQHEATVGLLLTAMTRDDIRPMPDVLTPHVAVAVQAAGHVNADPLVIAHLLKWLGDRHYDYGDLESAASYLQEATAIARQSHMPRAILPVILHDLVKVRRAAGDIDGAVADADEWAVAARSAGASLDEYHARFARAATLVYAGRFAQAETEFLALANESKPSDLTISDKIIELSVLAEIHRAHGDIEAALDAVIEATHMARDQTVGFAQADHLAALSTQASLLERDLGHGLIALERQREAVSAARELGLRIPLARQLHGLASRLIDCDQTEEAAGVIDEGIRLTEAGQPASQLLGDFLQVRGRLALANEDPGTARRLLTEAIPLLEASGEPNRLDLAAAWFNLATTQMELSEPATAATSYLTARNIEVGVYGEDHPELIATEYHLAAARHAIGDLALAEEAIGRCLRIIRRGGPQARIWRDRALTLAIIIDLERGTPAQPR